MEEEKIEALGMRLANRAYLYRIFHIVFGAEPSSEELAALGSPETVEAFRYLSKVAQAADASISGDEGENEQEVSAASTIAKAVELTASFGEKADDAGYVESLKSDFTRLFLVPGKAYVYPWESPYIGKEVMLFQESTLDVRNRYAEYGFAAVGFGHFPEDHVSMMLDFLAHLSTRAFDAFGDERDEEVVKILSSQKDFIAVHLADWLADFHEDLCKKDSEEVYSTFAGALRAFLTLDGRFIEETLSEELTLS